MAWTYAQIIAEADTLVPNASSIPDKCNWLNEVNNLFFEVVQIPAAVTFTTAPGTDNAISLPSTAFIKGRKIDRVLVGTMRYLDFLYSDVPPGQAYFVSADTSSPTTLLLYPNPPTEQPGIVRYFKTANTSVTSSNYTSLAMEAPAEYGWIYVLGLAERIAKAIPDVSLANNYAADFQRQLLIAKQSFQNPVG